MRIAIVINSSWNIFNFRMTLVRALLAHGHEVIAIAPQDDYSQRLVEAGCRYVPLSMAKGSDLAADLKVAWQLYRLYRKLSPHVVLHYTIKPNIYGTLAAHWAGIPAINNVSGLGTVFISKGLISGVVLQLYRWAFRYPAKVFFQNEDDRRLFLKLGLLREEITEVLPGSGIDLNRFTPGCGPADLKRFTFLMVARLLYEKGVVEYVEACRLLKERYPHIRCQLLGQLDEESRSGISRAQMESWQVSGAVDYLGYTDEVASVLAGADCLVLPSYREGVPRALLEGAAMGKPLIASNVPGCRDVVQQGVNGLLCRVRNAPDLADKMEQMLQSGHTALEQMGSASRRIAEERFDDRIVIARYLKAIKETTESIPTKGV